MACLIANNDESAYHLVAWCNDNGMQLNISKTKVMIPQKQRSCWACLNGEATEQVNYFQFLGSIISNDLRWEVTVVSTTQKAPERL